jgi:glucose uptake protein
MIATLLAVTVILAWGLWLVPSQRSGVNDGTLRTLGVTASNFIIATVVYASGDRANLSSADFAAATVGGVLWALAGVFAMRATIRIGIASAMGIWSPLNVLTALVAGVLLFRELLDIGWQRQAAVVGCVLLLLLGLGVTVYGRSSGKGRETNTATQGQAVGWLSATAAGVLWGVYFLPVRWSDASIAAAAWPMALGMLLGALIVGLPRLRHLPRLRVNQLLLLLFSGGLWSIGNYTSLALMERVGMGVGFSLAQACLAVNALAGIAIFADPPMRSAAARWTVLGVLLTIAGAASLGVAS